MGTEAKPVRLPLEERIRRRAQELYEQRGRQAGSALQDWLQAEKEIRDEEAQDRLLGETMFASFGPIKEE